MRSRCWNSRTERFEKQAKFWPVWKWPTSFPRNLECLSATLRWRSPSRMGCMRSRSAGICGTERFEKQAEFWPVWRGPTKFPRNLECSERHLNRRDLARLHYLCNLWIYKKKTRFFPKKTGNLANFWFWWFRPTKRYGWPDIQWNMLQNFYVLQVVRYTFHMFNHILYTLCYK